MRYEARITMYDALDRVVVVLNASNTDATARNDAAIVLNRSVDLSGVGEDDLTQWTVRGLVALLSALRERGEPPA
jgi:hypothetical protein